jgi:hypothetical protein
MRSMHYPIQGNCGQPMVRRGYGLVLFATVLLTASALCIAVPSVQAQSVPSAISPPAGTIAPVASSAAAAPEQFGAAGNCVADDTNALISMRDELRAAQDSSPGATVMLTMRFGAGKCYKYTNNRWTWGLKNLQMLGNGAQFQNVYSGTVTGAAHALVTNRGTFSLVSSNITDWWRMAPLGPLIKTARKGDTAVHAKTPSAVSDYPPGTWVLVNSYNLILRGGFPPAARYFDFARVVTTDSSTGGIVLDRPLANIHSESAPELPNYSNPAKPIDWIGRARITRIGYDDIPFADSLYMENMTFLDNPNAARPGDKDVWQTKSHNYLLISGVYSARLKNVTAGAFIPSSAHDISVVDSHFYLSEPDKLVDTLSFSNTVIDTSLFACTGVNTLRYIGGSVGGPRLADSTSRPLSAVACAPRHGYFENVAFSHKPGLTSTYPTFNLNVSIPTSLITIKNSTFTGSGGQSRPVAGSPTVTLPVDGATTSPTSVRNQVRIMIARSSANTPDNYFLTCPELGGQVGLIKAGSTAETLGTITSISGEGIGVVRLDIDIAGTIAVGDKLTCHPIARGKVQLIGNTYNNYGGPPQLP